MERPRLSPTALIALMMPWPPALSRKGPPRRWQALFYHEAGEKVLSESDRNSCLELWKEVDEILAGIKENYKGSGDLWFNFQGFECRDRHNHAQALIISASWH